SGVAVHAGKVTAADQIPDDYGAGAARWRRLERARLRYQQALHIATDAKHGHYLPPALIGIDPKPGFLQYTAAVEYGMSLAVGTDHGSDLGHHRLDLFSRTPMHHREQVVSPQRQMTRPTIAVTDEIQRSDFPAQHRHLV